MALIACRWLTQVKPNVSQYSALILTDEGSALTVCSGQVIKDSCLAFCHNFVF